MSIRRAQYHSHARRASAEILIRSVRASRISRTLTLGLDARLTGRVIRGFERGQQIAQAIHVRIIKSDCA